MRSLRNRLIAATLAATLLILMIAAFLIYGLIRGTLVAEFDDTLLTKARAIAAVAEQDEGRFELDIELAQMSEFKSREGPEYFEIWSSDGVTLARSLSLSDHSLHAIGATAVARYEFIKLPNNHPGRQVTVVAPIRTDHGSEEVSEEPTKSQSQAMVTIGVARDTYDLDQTLWRLAMLLGSVVSVAEMMSAAVMIAIVNRTLKPVASLAAQISEVNASNVSGKGQLTCTIEELDPVVDRLNELLKRLDTALLREKAFTADVAHELRTPLAGLSLAMEVCVSKPRDEVAYRDVIQKCLGTTQAMQVMVENLLTLARADAGQLTCRKESVDVMQFSVECWRPFEERAIKRGLHVHWPQNLEPIKIVTDRDKLRLVLRNLFDNAVRHAAPGSSVTIDASYDTKAVQFEVHNTGCDLPPFETEKVFERFWKHDTARTEGAEHCGLGLSLCRRIMEALDGSIAALVANGTFSVVVRLPMETGEVCNAEASL